MQLWIGTSGYAYPEWTGVFYPRGTSSARMLATYAETFPLVELDFSYYQMPSAEQMKRMAGRVPAAFQFILKAHRSLTHERDEKQLPPFAECLVPMRQSGQLSSVLCQFPQRFHHGQGNIGWIERLQRHLAGVPISIEFRHRSWDRPDVIDWLREKRLTLVSVDVPEIAAIFPRKLVQSGPEIYVRLHSRRASSWYGDGADRYDYFYSDAEMQGWIDALADRAKDAEKASVLFNNCRRANAVINARRFAELLAGHPQPFRVVPPPPPAILQGSLFDPRN